MTHSSFLLLLGAVYIAPHTPKPVGILIALALTILGVYMAAVGK